MNNCLKKSTKKSAMAVAVSRRLADFSIVFVQFQFTSKGNVEGTLHKHQVLMFNCLIIIRFKPISVYDKSLLMPGKSELLWEGFFDLIGILYCIRPASSPLRINAFTILIKFICINFYFFNCILCIHIFIKFIQFVNNSF